MAVIVTRITNPTGGTAKGSPLTSVEIDANFNNINDAKAEYPTQTGNAGKYLQTNGSTASWALLGNAATVVTNANLTGGVTSVGNATTVVTNANLTGMVTSSGNATTVVTNANLTGGVTSVGNAATVITNANLTGMVTSSGNATTVVTNANLTGEVTSVGNATTVPNATVIGKALTGYTSGAGTVAATDTILQAVQKLNGNAGKSIAVAMVLGL